MKRDQKCRYCNKTTSSEDKLTEHLSENHEMAELSPVDRKRVEQYTQRATTESRLGAVSERSPVSRRATLAALAGGVTAVGGLAAAAGSSLPPSSTESSSSQSDPPQLSADSTNEYYRDPNNWSSSGPDTHFVSDTSVYEEGVDLEYDSDDFSASYEFATTAQRTTTIEFNWNWRYCHSFNDSDADAFKFADTPDGTFVTKIHDGGGCVETATGTDALEIYQGRDWGIRIEGSHFDSRNEISGRFAVNIPITVLTEVEGDNVTFSNTTMKSGN